MKECFCGIKLNKTQKKYCSPKCLYQYRVRPRGLQYKIVAINKAWFKDKGDWIDKKGYRRHRGISPLVHRQIMSQYLDRNLERDEVVHHKNGNKQDNNMDNLQLMLKTEHDKLHNGRGIKSI